jgi:hypothetical protein
MKTKAQTEIISVILIITLVIALTGTILTWALPLIQKRQDAAVAERVAGYFNQDNSNSLPSEIEFIANTGGEKTFSFDVNGLLFLNETGNWLSFTFFSKVRDVCLTGEPGCPSSGWVSKTVGATCPPSTGLIGKDKASVVCERADAIADGFNITHRIYFRRLYDATGTKGIEIDLVKHEASPPTSTGKMLRMFYSTREGEPISATKVKILLG